jgi:rhodanese-related sulfurtransferase
VSNAWRLSSLSLERKLAVAALSLGMLALFAQPYRGNVVTLDVKELASAIEREDDHVTAGELAAWIVEGRSDYRLIDLRGAKEYADYHIPTAENVALATLPDAALEHAGKLVLYSDGGLHASQAWMLMRAKGFRNAYTLKGGLEEWKDAVLFPSVAADAMPQDRARFERAVALSRFFGGGPRAGAAAAVTATPPMPRLEAPVPAAGAQTTTPKRKKEGC